jgi:hypothetical protein
MQDLGLSAEIEETADSIAGNSLLKAMEGLSTRSNALLH